MIYFTKKIATPLGIATKYCEIQTLFHHFERLFFIAYKAREIERSRATRLRFSRLGQVEIAVTQSAKSARSELVAPATNFGVVRILRTTLCKRHNRPFSLIIDTSQRLVFCPLCAIHAIERVVGKLWFFTRITRQKPEVGVFVVFEVLDTPSGVARKYKVFTLRLFGAIAMQIILRVDSRILRPIFHIVLQEYLVVVVGTM